MVKPLDALNVMNAFRGQHGSKRSINPVRPEGFFLQDAEPGEQFHGSSAS